MTISSNFLIDEFLRIFIMGYSESSAGNVLGNYAKIFKVIFAIKSKTIL
jgi:hypothetical protein